MATQDPEFEAAFERVAALAQRFHAHREEFLRPDYTEAKVRQDFIDKFFSALGWDVFHESQTNPLKQEVAVEKPVADGRSKRRADYSFSIAPNYRDPRFFAEAKKPFGDIATKDNYFQTVRYAWNQGTPIAVLTDFEQFHVIDCRYKPDIDASLGRAIKRYHYTDYTDRAKFATIFYVFGRTAVADGAIERIAAELPKLRGKAVQRGLFAGGYKSVDEEFLKELDDIRDELARMLKNGNSALTGEVLTEVTQRIVDRLVFIRFLEDKLIEPEHLVAAFGDRATVWEDFLAVSRRLDGIYNGIVFKKHPTLDAGALRIDDGVFGDICERLSHHNSPYDFDAIPIHILGSIYERFLGKVIVATDKRAKVVEKPEVRKAGGVYYTPEYIVRFIVERTIGPLVAGKSPAQIAKMRFADLSCGSGSFLLGVYDFLLRYHREWYAANPKKAKPHEVDKHDDGIHLTLAKKREILINNIFGVDIDHQAVEVAQLSLYLKLLEEETTASAREHQLEFHETLLPSLNRNVVAGNSIISRADVEGDLFDFERERALHAMSFDARFPEIMQGGGFDAIVGNPPYVRMEQLSEIKSHLERYKSFEARADLYTYFVERGLSLLKAGGKLGFIVSNKWLKARYGGPLRELLAHDARIDLLVDFGELPVFQAAATFPCILLLDKASGSDITTFDYCPIRELRPDALPSQVAAASYRVSEGPNHRSESWSLTEPNFLSALLRYERGVQPLQQWLGEHVIGWGIKTGLNEAFIVSPETAAEWARSDPASKQVVHPLLIGDEIRRYETVEPARFLIYAGRGFDLNMSDAVREHLRRYRKGLQERATVGTHAWYELQQPQPRYAAMFGREKIVWPEIAKEPRFTLVGPGIYLNNKCFFTDCNSKVLLGILNSKLVWLFLKMMCSILGDAEKGGRLELRQQYVSRIPIPSVKGAKKKTASAEIERLVGQVMLLTKKLAGAATERERDYIDQRVRELEEKINSLVYDLYELSDEERAFVEAKSGSTSGRVA